MRWLILAAFVATIPTANWLLVAFGVAPAVLVIGAGFVLRDAMRERGGRGWALAAIVAGAGLSFALAAPGLALASVLSFAAAELADFALYERLRERSKAGAVMASGLIGAPLDTVLFLSLAGLPLSLATGMTVGKLAASAAVALLLAGRARLAETQP